MPDPLGHSLLGQRIRQIPTILEKMLRDGGPALSRRTQDAGRFIITGTGSSEAHARYLATLLNFHTDRAASYLPLSGFSESHREAFAGKTLVVFSQGVSPNAQIALRRRSDFAHTILFTATSPTAAREAGKADRALLLQQMLDDGGEIIEFPLAEEYTTLIRFVGPMAGYLACLQFASQLSPSRFQNPSAAELLPLLQSRVPPPLFETMKSEAGLFAGGFNLVTAAPISDFAQNLACKFMEGLFWACPSVSDFLQFAHGPFQQTAAHPRPVVILKGNSALENELVGRSVRMLSQVGISSHVVAITAPPLLSIFGFEAALNDLVYRLIVDRNVDQVNWPGKGRDDLLYGFCEDV